MGGYGLVWRWLLPLAAVALLGACSAERPESSAPSPPAAAAKAKAGAVKAGAARPAETARAEARQIFATRCNTCHGAQGAGDGPASASLNPPPRDFRDPEWQRSVTDTHIEQIVQYGGAAVGRSPTMPGNPDLMAKPDVVAALRDYIRSLAAP